ncbi:glycosyltransferase [Chitinophagaceae bacterium LB-8]|uniref:Glycosyltransferase n=1 Tax=Paraflavisolibacter caeni TaxID=2982496 RepID=A0A9X2XTW7_9BACT|nr:glycosyltransferase [Paraflavisolibacter caeni]MCU7548282.1 glycosyltransferase [Paraflavisolibacter caeni]
MATKVLELEIPGNIISIPFEEGYDHYRVLVRMQKQPVGWLNFSRNETGSISAEDLCMAIKRQLGPAIIQEFLSRSFVRKNDSSSYEGISVVVCTRNRTAQLAQCLQTLLQLPYPNYEIIIVDNAPSNDDTQQLVANFPVHYVRENCPGLDWARNRGIAEAKYPIIAFTDDDVIVDKYWLQAIANIFLDKQVMGVSGYVAPAELETQAQHVFELGYGGMGHGFLRRFIRKGGISEKQLLWASNFGIGANMAFRREIFQKIGGFDTALDVGTPSNGGGDIEFFHRLVNKGHLFVYEPTMLVWHYHRKENSALSKQIFNNGCSFGCYLIVCFRKKTVRHFTILQFFILDWFLKWNLKNLIHPTKIPIRLSLYELFGMLTSPISYWKTLRWNKQVRKKYGTLSGTRRFRSELGNSQITFHKEAEC